MFVDSCSSFYSFSFFICQQLRQTYYSALSIASTEGYTEIVQFLLSEGVCPNDGAEGGKYYYTPLMNAVVRNRLDNAKLLMDNGASLAGCKFVSSVPELALHHGSLEMIKLIVEREVVQEDECGSSLLHYACGHLSFRPSPAMPVRDKSFVLPYLVGIGMNINGTDNNGRTPLMIACQNDLARDAVPVLLELKADVNMKDEYGKTPLLYLMHADSISPDTLHLLLSHGADASVADIYGNNAIMHLCKTSFVYLSEKMSIMDILLEAGADPGFINVHGECAIHTLMRFRQYELVEHLILSGFVTREVFDDCGLATDPMLLQAARTFYDRQAIDLTAEEFVDCIDVIDLTMDD